MLSLNLHFRSKLVPKAFVRRFWAVLGPSALALVMASCVPYRMTKKVEAPGARKLGKEPDSNVIRPGVTTRAEVIEKFHAVDIGLKSERLFIGRWARSVIGVAGSRQWGARNLIVAFDEKGIVGRFQVCDDTGLLQVLPDYVREEKSLVDGLKIVHTVQIPENDKRFREATMVIEKGALRIGDLEIPRDQINGLAVGEVGSTEPNPNFGKVLPSMIKFVLLVPSSMRRNAKLQTDVPTLVDLERFLNAPVSIKTVSKRIRTA